MIRPNVDRSRLAECVTIRSGVTPAARPLVLAVLASLAACGERPAPHAVAQREGAHLSGRLVVPDEPAAGEWRTAAGDLAAQALDVRDPTADGGCANALPDLPGAGRLGGVLFDFCLP